MTGLPESAMCLTYCKGISSLIRVGRFTSKTEAVGILISQLDSLTSEARAGWMVPEF